MPPLHSVASANLFTRSFLRSKVTIGSSSSASSSSSSQTVSTLQSAINAPTPNTFLSCKVQSATGKATTFGNNTNASTFSSKNRGRNSCSQSSMQSSSIIHPYSTYTSIASNTSKSKIHPNANFTNNPLSFSRTAIANNANASTTHRFAVRTYSSSIRKDKYGRFIKRRVVVIKDRSKLNQQARANAKLKNNKNKWPKLPKIITPTNVPLQPLQPPPNLQAASKNLNPSSTSALSSSASSSSSTTAAAGRNAATATTTSSSSTTAGLQQQVISKEKQMLSGATIPPATKTKKFNKWLMENSGTIILNMGSICTLTAFTRTDMLELRMLSIVGSMSTMYYFLSRPPPLVYGPMIWSSIFLSTNVLMAYYILEEREGKTRQFTQNEENVYEEHFLPYGVTPRQYEKLLNIMVQVKLKRGEVLLQKDDTYDAVYLVTSGSTYGMTAGSLSRRVTAASSMKGNREKLSGGDAGAWIGELAFLEILGNNEKTKSISKAANNAVAAAASQIKRTNTEKIVNISIGKDADGKNNVKKEESVVKTIATAAANALERKRSPAKKENQSMPAKSIPNNVNSDSEQPQQSKEVHQRESPNKKALLTYIAVQDAVIYKWDFDKLAHLLSTSTELQLAVTRAMTAAVVNKVVNLYLSKQDADSDPNLWKQWMSGVNQSSVTMTNVEKEIEKADEKRMTRRFGTVRLNIVQKD